jgi:hypothetical protein
VRRDDEDPWPDGDGSPLGRDPFSLDDLVVPDDARELDAEARALRREWRARQRRTWLGRLFLTRRWRRYGLSGPIVIVVLMIVASTASLMLLFQPRRNAARPVPIATGVRDTGMRGDLMPDLLLRRSDSARVRLRNFRPALVAVMPEACDCESLLQTYGIAVQRSGLRLVLVGRQVPDLPPSLAGTFTVRARDSSGRLVDIYRPANGEPAMVFVRGDGVVSNVLTAPPSESVLDSELAVLVASGSITEPTR